jgi:hypothetical protein
LGKLQVNDSAGTVGAEIVDVEPVPPQLSEPTPMTNREAQAKAYKEDW